MIHPSMALVTLEFPVLGIERIDHGYRRLLKEHEGMGRQWDSLMLTRKPCMSPPTCSRLDLS